MPTAFDLSGQKFGRLTVIERSGSIDGNSAWLCECDCGTVARWRGYSLKEGNTTSCGCVHKEAARKRLLKHGLSKSREYSVWSDMIQRCTNPSNEFYKDYGERGINVCPRWKNSFLLFHEDMGDRPSDDHTLDRMDNSMGYFKENCRWVTNTEQQRNKRNNRRIEFSGKMLTVGEIAEATEVDPRKLRWKMKYFDPASMRIEDVIASVRDGTKLCTR